MTKELGSAPLENAKHEKMVQLYAAGGLTPTQAYARAGFKPDSGNASRVFGRPEVEARLAWLQQKASVEIIKAVGKTAGLVAATRELVIEQLVRNARIAMGDEEIAVVMPGGKKGAKVTIRRTDRDAAAANRALHLLGLELGMFKTEQPAPAPADANAARSAQDPRVADQLRRYANGAPRLIAKDGKRTG